MRAYRGKFFHLDEHWLRLRWSCEGLGHPLPMTPAEFTAWTEGVLAESGWKDAIVRLSVHWDAPEEGAVVAIARPFASHPAEWYRDGVSLASTVMRRSELRADDTRIKCSQYVAGVLATLDQGERRAHELVFFGPSGTVAEGTVSNLFIVKEKRVLTPSVASGILSGVTRAFVIDLCRKRGLEVLETFLTRHEIYNAEECFMTNTSSEVLPVVSVDARKIGGGKPGPVTQALGKDFKDALEGMADVQN